MNPQEEIVFVVDDARVRELLPLVVSGLRNRQAAAELGISELTLQIHGGNVMQRMAAASLADLVPSEPWVDAKPTAQQNRPRRCASQ